MENILKEQFESALLIVKKYKAQQKKLNSGNLKLNVVESVLKIDKEKIKNLLEYIFLEKEEMKYSEVVYLMHEYLNDKLFFKIGIRNTKLIFQEYLNQELILSEVKVMSSFKVYTKNKLLDTGLFESFPYPKIEPYLKTKNK